MRPSTLHCYGTRGSIPAPHREFLGYGGNTASHFLRTPAATLIFLDAGTGIVRACEEQLDGREKGRAIVLLSHTHTDHVYGLGMCGLRWYCAGHGRKSRTEICGPRGLVRGLDRFYDGASNWPVVIGPVPGSDASSILECFDRRMIRELKGGESTKIDGSAKMETLRLDHPVRGGSMAYRITLSRGSATSASVVYATDYEFDFLPGPRRNPRAGRMKRAFAEFVRGADVLLTDAQYTSVEYGPHATRDHRGFGHATIEQVVDIATQAGVRRLLITHHGRQTDRELEKRERSARVRSRRNGSSMHVAFAREGMRTRLL